MTEAEHVHQKLSFREKAGYSLGDIATNFFFMSMLIYQSRFYTDTMGLSPVAVGWMFILVRWADALFDPLVGALSDRTETRWGKFRPWVLFTAVPFGLVFWLTYTTPHFGPTGKLIYAYITYVLAMALYSANNTPYSALMGVMTPDASERSSIATYRFFAAIIIGQLLIQALALPLVDKFGQGDSAKGWSITMGIFGASMVVLYLLAFLSTRERMQPDPKQKSRFSDDVKDVFTCGPWIVMFILTLLAFTTIFLRGGAMNYYFAYYLDQGAIREFLDKVGLASIGAGEVTGWKSVLNALGLIVKPDGSNAASVGFAFFLTTGNLIQIIGILASKPLADRFSKKAVFIGGMGFSTIITALIFVVPPGAVTLLFVLSLLWGIGWGFTVPLLWVMMADVADYSEWKNSRRATGLIFAGIVFALKAGVGLGGALTGWLLAAYGYVPNVAQSAQALLGIRLCATIYSAIPFILGLVCLVLYPISKELNLRIADELAERRKKFAPQTPLS